MDLAEVISQVNEIKTTIEEKYGKIMAEIQELDKQLAELEKGLAEIQGAPAIIKDRSTQYINDQSEKIKAKIQSKLKAADEWLNNKKSAIETKLNGAKKDIQDQLKTKAEQQASALGGF